MRIVHPSGLVLLIPDVAQPAKQPFHLLQLNFDSILFSILVFERTMPEVKDESGGEVRHPLRLRYPASKC